MYVYGYVQWNKEMGQNFFNAFTWLCLGKNEYGMIDACIEVRLTGDTEIQPMHLLMYVEGKKWDISS